jgi:exonuclease SbcD
MLTILHTADWHIGQSFYGYERKEEHLAFFEWLKMQVAERCPDVLLVAGDVFDSPNPSAESQRIYYRFLREISAANPLLHIIIVAGNHDSAARLEAPNPLLEEMNVTVRGVVKRNQDGEIDCRDLLIPIAKGGEIVAWCVAVPYLRQGDYPPAESYVKGVELMYETLLDELDTIRTPAQTVIVMGHLQTKGACLSEKDSSERAIVGGLECVSADVFARRDVAYVALGHLHRCQTVAGLEHIRYAGSPLPMSFAEKNYKQGVYLAVFNGNKLETLERTDFDPLAGLLSIPREPKPLDEALVEIAKLPDGEITNRSPYLEIKTLLTEPEPSIRYCIENALSGKSVRLACIVSNRLYSDEQRPKSLKYDDLKEIDPLEIAQIAFRNQYDSDMPEKMQTLLKKVIREVTEELKN